MNLIILFQISLHLDIIKEKFDLNSEWEVLLDSEEICLRGKPYVRFGGFYTKERNEWGVFNIKINPDGFVVKLVAKLYALTYVVDRHLFFGCQTHFCLLVYFSICFRELTLHQLDINNAFPHDDQQEKVYIENPSGFVAQGKYHKVCILKKPRYGWKQSPRAWFEKLSEVVNLIWKWVNMMTQSSINNQLTLSS